jgi:hypothetical protein
VYYKDGIVNISIGDAMNDISITVEDGEVKKGQCKVVFRDSEGKLIGVPLRGVDKATAEAAKQSLGFAFEYGAKHATEFVSRQVNRLWWSVK